MSVSPKDVVLFLERLRRSSWVDPCDDEYIRFAISAVLEMCPEASNREPHTLVRGQVRSDHGVRTQTIRRSPMVTEHCSPQASRDVERPRSGQLLADREHDE